MQVNHDYPGYIYNLDKDGNRERKVFPAAVEQADRDDQESTDEEIAESIFRKSRGFGITADNVKTSVPEEILDDEVEDQEQTDEEIAQRMFVKSGGAKK